MPDLHTALHNPKSLVAKLLLPYQKRWLADTSMRKLARKSRQIGFSWTQALEDTLDAATGKWNICITTKDKLLAKQYINDCRFWANKLKLLADFGETLDQDTLYRLEFRSGKKIEVVSSNPAAVIGRREKIVIDEFDSHHQQEALFEAAEPCTTWGFPLIIFSAHYNDKSTFFNDLIAKHQHYGFSLHTITFAQAVQEGLLDRILAKTGRVEVGDFVLAYTGKNTTEAEQQAYLDAKRRAVRPVMWERAYMCNPEDAHSAFFTYDLLATAETEHNHFLGIFTNKTLKELEHLLAPHLRALQRRNNPFYLGIDFGRKINYTVAWGVEIVNGIKTSPLVFALQNVDTPTQVYLLSQLIALPNHRRTGIDYRGMGVGLGDYLQARFGTFAIEFIEGSLTLNEKMVYALYNALTDKRFTIPAHEVVREDFHSIRKETSPTGKARYIATPNKEDDASHADFFWAAAYANIVSETTTPPLDTLWTHSLSYSDRAGVRDTNNRQPSTFNLTWLPS